MLQVYLGYPANHFFLPSFCNKATSGISDTVFLWGRFPRCNPSSCFKVSKELAALHFFPSNIQKPLVWQCSSWRLHIGRVLKWRFQQCLSIVVAADSWLFPKMHMHLHVMCLLAEYEWFDPRSVSAVSDEHHDYAVVCEERAVIYMRCSCTQGQLPHLEFCLYLWHKVIGWYWPQRAHVKGPMPLQSGVQWWLKKGWSQAIDLAHSLYPHRPYSRRRG